MHPRRSRTSRYLDTIDTGLRSKSTFEESADEKRQKYVEQGEKRDNIVARS